ncbi:aspartate 1-decarboxylase [Campylobacter sp. MIT 21-1685]|uniref:aspartate 1-decarboxylase n=1 Tax=unclassified Campylobacter TaxID=2593542 RepID=UPI00224A53D8|nr:MULTISPECIES: aspartate 1-decarboxylase [unclassified Campylobacter]MCX2682389.1 aspartate 1-decarboxylase [Campylobacter sp. MIT 21-1684]MCX2750669.1 aspartate 1-decarboxylase [Campylobacter sp. MIT 21-1682]MCX2806783.1 aspartate 1-decarboxylase [Campylobacter sp. MIT 21-1685]
MKITMLKAKIHRATVSEARLDYVGSITIDSLLLKESGILEYEKVQVVNINTGARFETYTIAGVKGSGVICLNGAAARLVNVNDKIIIMSYTTMKKKKALRFKPKIIFVNDKNDIEKVSHYEKCDEIFHL